MISLKMTYFAKYFYFIASLMLTAYALVISSNIINPLLAAFILALALQPLATCFEKIKIPRLLSSIMCVLIFIVLIVSLLVFLTLLVGNMDFELDSVKIKYSGVPGKIQRFITEILNISLEQQAALIKEFYTNTFKNSVSIVNNTLTFTTNFLSSLVFFALSLTFILFYRRFLVTFLVKIVRPKYHTQLRTIIEKTKSVINQYIFGISLIILIVAILNSIGLLILGIKNAIIFGVIAAILTLIPYIGIAIGSLLPVVFALLTKDSIWYPVSVFAIFMFVQFLEGNFLTPNIVGRQVSINPFAAILALIFGGSLLGLIGIIFAIPMLAIFKSICDEISALKPIGYLIGNHSNEE